MPRRDDLNTVMIIGSGPIIIGQACEFDYSATQGCKALKEDGFRLILLNSNPATIMTDPDVSDRTYIEPMTVEVAVKIIEKERVDAILPTLGGQTALNLAMDLYKAKLMTTLGVKMIGSTPEVIEIAESRQAFRSTMTGLGLDIPVSDLAQSVEEALAIAKLTGFPAIVRPSYTLGGNGGGVAFNSDELKELAWRGLAASPVHQILVEESLIGWKEMELEMIRDLDDNAIIVCGIENVDPMGVHTGDSVTVAPIQTLTDEEYQAMRDEALRVARAVGLNGGCNIQFAINPKTGRRVVIEMNPRVSRSSALASKATGYPIARVASKLAVGYTLGELKNDITGKSACFEPALDYCVVKAPRFNFEKFAGASSLLGLEMKAVGETMALGGNYREALQKALRGLEIGQSGLSGAILRLPEGLSKDERLSLIKEKLVLPLPERLSYVHEGLKLGLDPELAVSLTGMDPWFIRQIELILEAERYAAGPFAEKLAQGLPPDPGEWRYLKAQGLSDARLAELAREAKPDLEVTAASLSSLRERAGVIPHFRQVDTCAGEFLAMTPYYYSSYDSPAAPAPEPETETTTGSRPKVMILGGGPNRIGQGIEFDYCCVKATQAFNDLGYHTIMVNSNPETVSTDYDAVGRLYFEPVTLEDVLAICDREKPDGVIVQLGGQTPLNLAKALKERGVKIWGTDPDSIFQAEDRHDWNSLVGELGLLQPPGGMAEDAESAKNIADRVGYPVIVRPSFVLGGRAMRVIHDETDLLSYVDAFDASGLNLGHENPILVDKFLDQATEVDVDAVADDQRVEIAAIMEHIERAGIHSGDSCCTIPPITLTESIQKRIIEQTEKLGKALKVKGLMNIQFAVTRDEKIYVLEANPRASRTTPFVAKATGRPLIQAAAQVMAGKTLEGIGFKGNPWPDYFAVKESVLPWNRFGGAKVELGPEMRSTGEVMGLDSNFGLAYLKSQVAAGMTLPRSGIVVFTIYDGDKEAMLPLAKKLYDMGFIFHATDGTCKSLESNGIKSGKLEKLKTVRPNIVDFVMDNNVQLVVNTTGGGKSDKDSVDIRAEAIKRGIPLITTIAGLEAAVKGLQARLHDSWNTFSIGDYYDRPPLSGKVLLNVNAEESDQKYLVPLAKELLELGFEIYATEKTRKALDDKGITYKLLETIRSSAGLAGSDISQDIHYLKEQEVRWLVDPGLNRTSGEKPETLKKEFSKEGIYYTENVSKLNDEVESVKKRIFKFNGTSSYAS
ncbi:MAG: carbamoyl-phosphate synthase large subunit [Deltaproteobacteria bacterium]|jgi:carbamoyl-phosphate synthase large subunit|nr:carbamoyl-phosphate synthase large subunit [Deltaproteobacteria bacterium]